MVPTVTRPAAPSADHDTVTSTERVQVLLDLVGNAEHVEGTVRCGDRRRGSPGMRVQTFVEPTFEFRVLVDAIATCDYVELPVQPTIAIVGGSNAALAAPAILPATNGTMAKAETSVSDALMRTSWTFQRCK